MEKLDRKAITSWRIGRVCSLFILGIIIVCSYVILREQDFYETIRIYLLTGYGIVLGYGFLGLIIYPSIEYRQWGYQITEDKVLIQHGIFFLETTVIPILRVQHIEILRGPVNRKLGLAKVLIYVASESHQIDGLKYETAMEISEKLKGRLYSRVEQVELEGRE